LLLLGILLLFLRLILQLFAGEFEIVLGVLVGRIELERLGIGLDRFGQLVEAEEGVAHIVIALGLDEAVVALERGLGLLEGLLVLVFLVFGGADIEGGLGCSRRLRLGIAVFDQGVVITLLGVELVALDDLAAAGLGLSPSRRKNNAGQQDECYRFHTAHHLKRRFSQKSRRCRRSGTKSSATSSAMAMISKY